jgi:hypothetical protein
MVNTSPLYRLLQAGGYGDHLRNHTWNKPKCSVSVIGKPFLFEPFDTLIWKEFLISALRGKGVRVIRQLPKLLKSRGIKFLRLHL